MKYFTLPEDLQFLTTDDIHEIHDEQISLYGGNAGFNDQKIVGVDAALGRVQNHIAYKPDTDLLRAAAVLWHGLTTAHAYLDGNKRTALMGMAVFLEINGVTYDRGGEYAAIFIENLFGEAGEENHVTLEDFERHLRQNTHALDYAVLAEVAPEDQSLTP